MRSLRALRVDAREGLKRHREGTNVGYLSLMMPRFIELPYRRYPEGHPQQRPFVFSQVPMQRFKSNQSCFQSHVRTALALSVLLLLPSCLVSGKSEVSYTGSRVTAETLALVEAGESEAFTLEVLGEPTARIERKDGSWVWRWDYAMVTDKEGGVFLLIMSKSKTSVERSTYVVLEDGVVMKAWQD